MAFGDGRKRYIREHPIKRFIVKRIKLRKVVMEAFEINYVCTMSPKVNLEY